MSKMEAGFVEGQDCAIEYRWADNQLDRLPELAAELLRQPLAVIVTNTPGALAAKAGTTKVPIVLVRVKVGHSTISTRCPDYRLQADARNGHPLRERPRPV
jgi:hypothetical protein